MTYLAKKLTRNATRLTSLLFLIESTVSISRPLVTFVRLSHCLPLVDMATEKVLSRIRLQNQSEASHLLQMNVIFHVSGPLSAAVKAYQSTSTPQKMLFVVDNVTKEQLATLHEIPYSRIFSIARARAKLITIAGVEVAPAADILDMPFEAQAFVAALLLAKRLNGISLAQLDGLSSSTTRPVAYEQFGMRSDTGKTQPLQRFVIVGSAATRAQLRAVIQMLSLGEVCEWEWVDADRRADGAETKSPQGNTEIHIPSDLKSLVAHEIRFWPKKHLICPY